jgi:hypothetical protein
VWGKPRMNLEDIKSGLNPGCRIGLNPGCRIGSVALQVVNDGGRYNVIIQESGSVG